MNAQHTVQITPQLYLTREEVSIIDSLVDHDEMPKDLGNDHAIAYFSGQDFHLVLYFADQHDRGFQMYVVEDFSVNVETMHLLSNSLSQLIQGGYKQHVVENAKGRVDQMIYMAGTFRALFGKKQADELEYLY